MDDTNNQAEAPELDADSAALPEQDNDAEADVEQQYDDEGNPIETHDEGELEDELEGVKLRGKKEALEKFKSERLMQADYTRKTQEVARERQAFEAERQQQVAALQLRQHAMQGHAELIAVERQLQQFSQVDWNSLIDSDPVQALKLQQQMRGLENRRGEVQQQISQAQNHALQLQQHSIAKQLQDGGEVLAREIKGWSAETAEKLNAYGRQLGASDLEISSVVQPWIVKALHKASLYDQLTQKQTAAKPKIEPQKPVQQVKAKSSSAAVDPAKMTDKQYAEWRHRQKSRSR